MIRTPAVFVTIALVLGLARPALAQPDQPDVLPREYECMVAHTKYGAKFIAGKTKCVSKCMTRFWKGEVPEGDCMPPYAGSTALCINDTVTFLKGVEQKFQAKLEKACLSGPGADCPECYSGGCASPYAESVVAQFEIEWDSFQPGIFCERAGAVKYEQRCQLYTARALTRHYNDAQKCYTKCLTNARSGGDVTTCMPPATDEDAIACLAKVRARAAKTIDKYCNDALYPDSVPDCGAYPSGATWTGLVESWVTAYVAPTFCASPSRAFLD